MSTLRVTFLMTFLTVMLVLLGGLLFGKGGALIALIISGILNFFSYWNSDKLVLRMYGAQEITNREAPELYTTIRNLTQKARIPMPRLYIINSEMANAFATGRNPGNAAIAVTTGLLHSLQRDEIAGVLAHEIGHIQNRDILISSVAATLAGAISMLAQLGSWSLFLGGFGDDDEGNPLLALLAIIVMPIAAMLVQMAISRSREYQADRSAAVITANPFGLANALRRLERAAEMRPAAVNPATSHLFIVNPLRSGNFKTLFSTHPPIEKRIARLEQMAYRS